MSSENESTVEQSGTEEISDVLSQVFGGEQVSDGGKQSKQDQAASDTPAKPDDQAGDDDDSARDGEEEQQEEAEEAESEEDELVEVKVDGKTLKVSPDIAAILKAQDKKYKSLEAEFTRRNQAAKQQQQQPARPAESAEKDDDGDLDSKLVEHDEMVYKAIADEEGRGITKIMGKMVHGMVRAQVVPIVQKKLDEFKQLLEESGVLEQVGLKRTEGFLAEITEQYGLNVADSKEVHSEAVKLARERGNDQPTREEFLMAVLAVQAKANKAPSKAQAKRPAAPGGSGLSGTRSFAGVNREFSVVHRDGY